MVHYITLHCDWFIQSLWNLNRAPACHTFLTNSNKTFCTLEVFNVELLGSIGAFPIESVENLKNSTKILLPGTWRYISRNFYVARKILYYFVTLWFLVELQNLPRSATKNTENEKSWAKWILRKNHRQNQLLKSTKNTENVKSWAKLILRKNHHQNQLLNTTKNTVNVKNYANCSRLCLNRFCKVYLGNHFVAHIFTFSTIFIHILIFIFLVNNFSILKRIKTWLKYMKICVIALRTVMKYPGKNS